MMLHDDDDLSLSFISFPILYPDLSDATLMNGGGNGVSGRVASITTFTIATEGSSNQWINNLLKSNYVSSGVSTMGAKWGGAIGQGVSLTYSFPTSNSVYSYVGFPDSKSAFSAEQQTYAINAMNKWANVANVTFSSKTESSTNAGDIRWSNTGDATLAAAAGYSPGVYSFLQVLTGDIWINPYAGEMLFLQPGEYGNQTMIHEMGHVLGLAHPHQSTVAPVASQDQLKYSIMSYHDYDGSFTIYDYYGFGNYFMPTTPMLNDIAAVQFLYGANTNYHAGNDTYSWSATAHVYETIWDAGGTDTISAATQTQAVVINLNSGQWSNMGVPFSNGSMKLDGSANLVNDCLTIAYGATIENAIGSAYKDTLIGNSANNSLTGGASDDTLQGNNGNDTLKGESGNDNLQGGGGNDNLQGGDGNDQLGGTSGQDTYNGGAGNDLFKLYGNTQTDTIQDFLSVDDTIQLENALFTALINTGTLSTSSFRAGAGFVSAATDSTGSNDFIIYNTTTGDLYYDASGNTGAASVKIAILATHPAITSADFYVI